MKIIAQKNIPTQVRRGKPSAHVMEQVIKTDLLKNAIEMSQCLESPQHNETKYFATDEDAMLYAGDHPKSPLSLLPDSQIANPTHYVEIDHESNVGDNEGSSENESEDGESTDNGSENSAGVNNTLESESCADTESISGDSSESTTESENVTPSIILDSGVSETVKNAHRDSKKRPRTVDTQESPTTTRGTKQSENIIRPCYRPVLPDYEPRVLNYNKKIKQSQKEPSQAVLTLGKSTRDVFKDAERISDIPSGGTSLELMHEMNPLMGSTKKAVMRKPQPKTKLIDTLPVQMMQQRKNSGSSKVKPVKSPVVKAVTLEDNNKAQQPKVKKTGASSCKVTTYRKICPKPSTSIAGSSTIKVAPNNSKCLRLMDQPYKVEFGKYWVTLKRRDGKYECTSSGHHQRTIKLDILMLRELLSRQEQMQEIAQWVDMTG